MDNYDTYKKLLDAISSFDKKCRKEAYTDTGTGHEILTKVRKAITDAKGTEELIDQIQSFQDKCEEYDYTDTVKLWHILDRCRDWLRNHLPRADKTA